MYLFMNSLKNSSNSLSMLSCFMKNNSVFQNKKLRRTALFYTSFKSLSYLP